MAARQLGSGARWAASWMGVHSSAGSWGRVQGPGEECLKHREGMKSLIAGAKGSHRNALLRMSWCVLLCMLCVLRITRECKASGATCCSC
jgi:hypothetical protein